MIDLSQFDQSFESAPEPEGIDKIDDGTYQATIQRFEVIEAKDGRAWMKWVLKIQFGEERGKRAVKISSIKEDQMEWLKKDLRACGINVKMLSELPDIMENVIGTCVEIQLKTKPNPNGRGYVQNIFINRPLESIDTPPEEDAPF